MVEFYEDHRVTLKTCKLHLAKEVMTNVLRDPQVMKFCFLVVVPEPSLGLIGPSYKCFGITGKIALSLY